MQGEGQSSVRIDGAPREGIAFAMSEGSPNVLFVCTGNTCRSPMAEGLFRGAVGANGATVSSAGVSAYGGGTASPETLDILEERGLHLDGFRSRMVNEQMIREATHVFCMTRGHLATLQSLYPEDGDKFYLVCDFVPVEGGTDCDVPDPIGGGRRAYEEVAVCLDAAIAGIQGFLQAEQSRSGE